MRWSNLVRFDSRTLLKLLIALNILLMVYQVFTIKLTPQLKNCSCDDKNIALTSHLQPLVDSKLKNIPSDLVITNFENINSQNNNEYTSNALKIFHTSSSQVQTQKIPWWKVEQRGSYTVIYDYIVPDPPLQSEKDTVTLTTQGTFEFLYHVEVLCKRWDGSISVAVYAPDGEFFIALKLVFLMRKCSDKCVSRNVYWHFIYDKTFDPMKGNISFPENLVNQNELSCDNSILNFIETQNVSFRTSKKIPYPINVARNVARLASKSKYLLASDIELYPSLNVVKMFKDLLEREKNKQLPYVQSNVRHVYVFPIFEVKSNINPPLTKAELAKLVKKEEAIFFHKFVCDVCQSFPDRDKWVDLIPENNTLNIFRSLKRTKSRHTWEPLYIGTNDEPLYEEKLTWEGKRDKMSQMYEMCLLNYDLLILDNAFLVHAPGIKKIDKNDQKKRRNFMLMNDKVYDKLILKLKQKYSNSKNQC